jgi:uncharacterized Fe-S radical SAM superfamily protein PflX
MKMTQPLGSVALMRPDAVDVWMDVEVCRRLSWYRKVMTGVAPAKFMLCRKIPAQIEEREDAWENLWTQHGTLSGQLDGLVANVENRLEDGWEMKDASPNLLDLKSILVNKMLGNCTSASGIAEWTGQAARSGSAD